MLFPPSPPPSVRSRADHRAACPHPADLTRPEPAEPRSRELGAAGVAPGPLVPGELQLPACPAGGPGCPRRRERRCRLPVVPFLPFRFPFRLCRPVLPLPAGGVGG